MTAGARLVALAIVSVFTASARAETFPLAPIVESPRWMAALADDLFVPGYTELAQRAQQLDQALRGLCASTDPAALKHAQAQWRAVAKTWRRLEALPIGPTLERRSLRRFDFWPTRVAQVEAAIGSAPTSVEALAQIGVSAQGLPALEYLLFDDKRRITSEAARCRYAGMLARAFADETVVLARSWRDWRQQWLKDAVPAPVAKAALTDVLNATVGTLEQLRVRKLEKPAQSRRPREPLFDAWRSGATRAHLLATFDGVRIVLSGGRSGIGLGAVLRGHGHHPLAAQLDENTRAVATAMQALPQDLPAPAAAAAIEQAISALARLQTALSTEVAEALRVTIGFNESDGD